MTQAIAGKEPGVLGRLMTTGNIIRALVIALVIAGAATTPGFFRLNAIAITVEYAALTGMVALAMTFITISGNILSLNLGATMATTAMVFLVALGLGLLPAVLAALACGAMLVGAQGLVIGYFRANPIVVTIAGLALITGAVTQITGGANIYPADNASLAPLRMRFGPVSLSVVVFILTAVGAQLVLSFTRFGRELYLTGSNWKAAEVAGLRPAAIVAGAYAAAGAIAGLAGVLLAARLQTASLAVGEAYDYDAIGAVLIGGIAIHGGKGSPFQAVLGAILLSAISTALVLRGLSHEYQHILTGLLVLVAIVLHARKGRK